MPRRQPAPAPAPVPLSVRLAQSGILAAAVDVFTKRGVAATRVEDLLEAASVARRTFYKYFGSKEAVLAALYELASGELLRAMQAASAESGDPFAGIRVGIDVYLDYHASNAALLKVLEEHAIRSDSPLAPLRRRFRGQVTELLERAVRTATGEQLDPMMYTALLSALEGISLQLLEEGARPAEIRRAKRTIHTLVERVLGTGGKPRGARGPG